MGNSFILRKAVAVSVATTTLFSSFAMPLFAEEATSKTEGELYTDEEGNYYYQPLEQGTYSNGGYTISKVSHSTEEPGSTVDSILDPKESGQSYTWSMATKGDYVYIGTCYNSTYYIYYNNVATSLKSMQSNGTISSDVNVESVAKSILKTAFGTDMFANEEYSPMKWKPVIMAVNKNTGEAEVIFRESDIIKDHKDMFPYGVNALSGYRMAFEFHGKIYFAGMGNPTATLVEVDPETNEAQIVYYNIIKSNSGASGYSGVSNGVHGLLVYDDEIYMCLATDNLKSFDPNAKEDVGGIIVASDDPSKGLSSWRVVATQDDFDNLPAVMQIDGLNGGGIWDIIEYNNSLYVTVVTDKTDKTTGKTNKQGFALYRGDKQSDNSFIWTQLAGEKETSVLPYGFGIDYSMSCNMWVYNGYLYFGTYNDPMLDLAAVPSSGNFEPLYHDLDHSIYLYRMDSNDNFEMVGGKNDNPEFPNGPIGNLTDGLGSNSNQYVWRYGEHDGELYIGTYDTSTLTYMFTQLTDGQVADLSDEEMNARASELEKALLEVLQKNDNTLLKSFLEKSIFSSSAQKLFQKLSGVASGLSKDKNPVPDYEKGLEDYETLKKIVSNMIDSISLTDSEETTISEELSDVINEVALEQDEVALNIDEYLESLSEEELYSLFLEEYPEEAISTADLDTDMAVLSFDDIKNKLKEKLTTLLNQLFEKTDEIVYNDDLHNFVYYFGVNYYAQQCEPGFDLLVSNDGVNFDAITRDGFGDGENHGLRTIGSTDVGVFMGTANPFHATQLWKLTTKNDDKPVEPSESPEPTATPDPTETEEPKPTESADPTPQPTATPETTQDPVATPEASTDPTPSTTAEPTVTATPESKVDPTSTSTNSSKDKNTKKEIKDSKNVKTGDTSNPLLYGFGLIASLIVVVSVILFRKQIKK